MKGPTIWTNNCTSPYQKLYLSIVRIGHKFNLFALHYQVRKAIKDIKNRNNLYGRVCYGYSLPHMLIVVIRYTIAIIHVALMTNLLCSCVLNFGYIFIFNIMNKILDETLFLATKIISVGTSLLVVTIDIVWKVKWCRY